MTVSCSALSASLGEALDGTAPSERGFVVVEHAGKWDRKAESALPELADATSAGGLRLQVVRRSKTRYSTPRAVAWVGSFDPDTRFLERVWADELVGLDLSGVADGRPLGIGVVDPLPLFLVCTHGTRDPCCAKLGLPLLRAVWQAAPERRAWHSSHLGGHRFAATMAVFPYGVWLGRVPAAQGPELVAATRQGRFPLEYARGIAGRPPAAQAAELHVRRELGIDEIDAVRVVAVDGELVTLRIVHDDRVVSARVRSEPAGERRLSCGAGAKSEDPGRWVVELLG